MSWFIAFSSAAAGALLSYFFTKADERNRHFSTTIDTICLLANEIACKMDHLRANYDYAYKHLYLKRFKGTPQEREIFLYWAKLISYREIIDNKMWNIRLLKTQELINIRSAQPLCNLTKELGDALSRYFNIFTKNHDNKLNALYHIDAYEHSDQKGLQRAFDTIEQISKNIQNEGAACKKSLNESNPAIRLYNYLKSFV